MQSEFLVGSASKLCLWSHLNSCPLAGNLQLEDIRPLIPELTWNKLGWGEVNALWYDMEKWLIAV